MRRTKAIRLTLLPLLASASLAAAQQDPAPQWGPPPDAYDGGDPGYGQEESPPDEPMADPLPVVVDTGGGPIYLVVPRSGRRGRVVRRGFGSFFWIGG